MLEGLVDQLATQQAELKAACQKIFESFPDTGLYDSAPCVSAFAAFLKHAQGVFESSPRTLLLADIERRVDALVADDPELAEALTGLGHTVATPLPFMELASRFETQPCGALCMQWRKLCGIAEHDPYTEDPYLVSRIRAGMLAKALSKTTAVNSSEIEKEVEDRIAEVLEKARAKRKGAADDAATLLPLMEADGVYVQYTRTRHAWEARGIDGMLKQYQDLDRTIGIDRNSRGSAFEVGYANVASELALRMLRQRGGGPPCVATADTGESPGTVQTVTCCHWYEKDAAGIATGRPVGEVDAAIVRRRGAAHAGDWQYEVLALLEMKSCLFEIASAIVQHEERSASCLLAIRVGEASGTHTATSCGSPQPALSPSNDPPAAEVVFARAAPTCVSFVVTTLPEHPFQLGADPEVIKRLMEGLGQRTRADSHRALSESEVEQLWLQLRSDSRLRLRESPLEVLRDRSDRIIVIP
jgi:hypothetical protein